MSNDIIEAIEIMFPASSMLPALIFMVVGFSAVFIFEMIYFVNLQFTLFLLIAVLATVIYKIRRSKHSRSNGNKKIDAEDSN